MSNKDERASPWHMVVTWVGLFGVGIYLDYLIIMWAIS